LPQQVYRLEAWGRYSKDCGLRGVSNTDVETLGRECNGPYPNYAVETPILKETPIVVVHAELATFWQLNSPDNATTLLWVLPLALSLNHYAEHSTFILTNQALLKISIQKYRFFYTKLPYLTIIDLLKKTQQNPNSPMQ
jgi:hypothetical protein